MMDDDDAPVGKQICAYRNGDYTKYVWLNLRTNIPFKELAKDLANKFDFSDSGNIRIFNSQGIELFKDEIQFLKNKDVIYVSKGEEFDRASSLAEYTIIRKLGEGGFATVDLGEHKITGQKVAIKTIFNSDTSTFAEADTLKSLGHKNIVKLQDCIPTKDMKLIFIMEYLEGGELYDYVKKKGRVSEEETRVILKQIAEAMVYCHERKIIHRDLKLENVLIKESGGTEVKVVDFGIAGLGSGVGSEKGGKGTMVYLPPEVLQGKMKAPHPSQDVWALGVMQFAMVCGELPFVAEKDEDLIALISKGAYHYPKDIEKSLSPEFKDLIAKTFVTDFNARIKTIDLLYHPWIQGKKLEADEESKSPGKAEESKASPTKKVPTPDPKKKGTPVASPTKADPASRRISSPAVVLGGLKPVKK